ncbi:DUF5335 domain-containing protein [Janthinobacterium fluminis]|uniref:DUF5335 family protein n=1 Tax=Janthinobacterium fluminis TaxID=2987524 RepID=A0ABT5K570_9BURK|nr:DUF5335 domain-containing protein [Janthinobacterium fluminis]MDC8760147.1 DUF5335 family protein [Janthinobacterium fluminis]
MTIAKIDKPNWHDYFGRISKTLVGKNAELEVDALEIGSQLEADWVPLLGIVYDPASDILAVMVEGLDHMIRHPQTLYVDMLGSELLSMEVNDADHFRHIIKLRDPLLLAAPHG